MGGSVWDSIVHQAPPVGFGETCLSPTQELLCEKEGGVGNYDPPRFLSSRLEIGLDSVAAGRGDLRELPDYVGTACGQHQHSFCDLGDYKTVGSIDVRGSRCDR